MGEPQRWFPIQFRHSPHGVRLRVPWRIAVKAYEVYARHHGSDQSCERMAERGGFDLEELIFLLAGEEPGTVTDGPLQSDFWNKFPEEVDRG